MTLIAVESSGSRRGIGPLLVGYVTYGAFWGTWAVAFADFLRYHDLSAARVSLGFTVMSIVAIALMTFVAPRLEGLPRNVTVSGALVIQAAGSASLVVLEGNWLAIAFVLMGAGTGFVDVFVNAVGSEIETRSGSSVLQWVHASYGAGGFIGALVTGVAMTLGLSFQSALVAASVAQLGAAALSWVSADLRTSGRQRSPGKISLKVFASRRGLIAPALVVLFAFFVEGSMDVWSVIFLRRTLGSSILGGAAGFAAFALAITIGRSFAARVLFGIGYRRTILVSGVGSLICASVAIVTTSPLVAGVAFLGLGFTLSAAAPAAFGTAGPAGQSAGLAVGAITTVGYAGFVVGPPIMGWLADEVGLRAAMMALVVATVGMTLAGRATRLVEAGSPESAGAP